MSVSKRALIIGILVALLAAGFTIYEHAAFFCLGSWGKALFALLCSSSAKSTSATPL